MLSGTHLKVMAELSFVDSFQLSMSLVVFCLLVLLPDADGEQ